MATLILGAAGQALGSAVGLGGFGSLLGKAAGALAGGALDQSLFGTSRTIETARLTDLDVQSSSEGASLPKVYGRVRLSGQVIWASRFEEVVSEENQGGKGGGGVTVRSYSYFGNFAVALCEGPVAHVGRIWADGKLLDTSGLQMRIYHGDEAQVPDPLIAALQEDAPAYRGTVYAVFERLPLEDFGNRLPQLSFEVIRPVDVLESQVRAVTIIPGAGEFAYAPQQVTSTPRPGVTESVNAHVIGAPSDWAASLDELQALCPNLERVALVVAWFGDDLRAGSCTIRPKVEEPSKATTGATWSAGGLQRAEAELVSRIDDRPAYGGTPSDDAVLAAIDDLKSRGLEVLLYPFVLMDIPPGNGLPDPYGAGEQAAFPWRGRMVPTGDIVADTAAFFGTASASDFSVSGGAVTYTGPAEWSYRRHILSLAALAKAAGGVESFLIGTELRGLTRAHTGGGSYPFVDQLVALVTEVRALLGPDVKLSYAADWSEYAGHQAGPVELRFPLDPLWAAPEIDFVGIDNYLPLADQRDGGDPDGAVNPYDLDTLRGHIAGGEYFDWYYASDADRAEAARSPITDGAYQKPWVYRAKDLWGWWANPHVERVAGAEVASPTAWSPRSKPVRFTELGIPAVDRGANQPNVFVDPKSSESRLPHFSRGTRDDLIQRRALEASLSFWDTSHPVLPQGDNPVSPVYGGPMVDPAGIYLWTWDARPYPVFPVHKDVWADGDNWTVGHWLTGRIGGMSLAALARALLVDYGISEADIRADGLPGSLDGLAVPGPVSARQVLEPLLLAFGGLAADRGTHVDLIGRTGGPVKALTANDLAETARNDPLLSQRRAQSSELAEEVRYTAADPLVDFRSRVAASRRLEGGSRHLESADLQAVLAPLLTQQLADRRLHRIWSEREQVDFALGPAHMDLEAGDVVSLSGTPTDSFDPPLQLRIEAIEETDRRRIEAVRVGRDIHATGAGAAEAATPFRSAVIGPPHAVMMDLPVLSEDDPPHAPRLAAFAEPWPGAFSLMRSAGDTGFDAILTIDRPAVIGRLLADLSPGPLWVVDSAATVEVEMFGGHLQSRSRTNVLAGANACAIQCADGRFEILQFENAELTGTRTYLLSSLLRGQRGTETPMLAGALTGAPVVFLEDGTVPPVPLSADQTGRAYNYRLVPQGLPLDAPQSLAFAHSASGVGALPFAPVHVRARRESGNVHLSWIRQTRIGGDSWEAAEVPLGEDLEAYEIDILGPGEAVLRTLSSGAPSVTYPQSEELADFGGPQSSLTVSISQLSATAGRGFARKATLHV